METFSYLLVFAFIVYVIIYVVIKPAREIKNLEEKISFEKNSSEITVKKNADDFYGTELMKNNPNAFLQIVAEKKQRLENGESIGVKASEFFYLIRNSDHKDLIVGEDGTINMKDIESIDGILANKEIADLQNRILNFHPSEREDENKSTGMQIPGYVKKVEPIKDGGTRWVFEEWHADECGIKTLCWDRFGRAMLDPDEIKDDSKNKPGKKDSGRGTRSSDEVTDLSKKVSRYMEMVEEARVDAMLAVVPEVDAVDAKVEFAKPSTLKPAELKDEIKAIEDEIETPDFMLTLNDDFENNLMKDIANKNLNTPVADVVEIDQRRANESQDEDREYFRYFDKERFFSRTAQQKEFIEAAMKSIFSSDGLEYIFVLYPEKQVFIEKNYFAYAIENLFSEKDRSKYRKDFFVDGSKNIFDGIKINELLGVISEKEKLFLSYGKGSGKMIFNMLFSNSRIKDDYFTGWYVKMSFEAHHCVTDFLDIGGMPVEVIASEGSEITRRSKILKNVRKTF